MLDTAPNRPDLPPEIARRRTFAIISHPDAGKTTLTEKFLLFGGGVGLRASQRGGEPDDSENAGCRRKHPHQPIIGPNS